MGHLMIKSHEMQMNGRRVDDAKNKSRFIISQFLVIITMNMVKGIELDPLNVIDDGIKGK